MDMAIGQQQVLTPLQLALMVGGMGNGKMMYQPHLVNEERNKDGILVHQNNPIVRRRLELNEYTLDVTREALAAVIKAGGTGTRAAVPGIPVGGKTGSAQNPHGDLSHAVFIACAPIDNPVIAMAVVVENAGGGGAVAAPIAGTVMRHFFAETEEGKNIYKKYNPEGAPRPRPRPAPVAAPIIERMPDEAEG
jgi:penicillin-binding protein 2